MALYQFIPNPLLLAVPISKFDQKALKYFYGHLLYLTVEVYTTWCHPFLSFVYDYVAESVRFGQRNLSNF